MLPSHSQAIERPFWKQTDGIWKQLYGGIGDAGLSVEWHDFSVDEPLAWSQSFHRESLEICLNYTGEAELSHNGTLYAIANEQIALYTTSAAQAVRATRKAHSKHRFLTLEFTLDYLRSNFGSQMEGLLPRMQQFLETGGEGGLWAEVGPLPSRLLSIRHQMIEPPVHSAAITVWYQSKVLEVLSQTIFRHDNAEELFCERHKRINRERIERARYLLERDIENPPSLEMLANEVNCSPFYLSRLFAEETGLSVPKYLRLKRVERAAILIREEGMSVTDAAMAVGYSSLSAFHKAFVDRHGVSPSQYGLRKK